MINKVLVHLLINPFYIRFFYLFKCILMTFIKYGASLSFFNTPFRYDPFLCTQQLECSILIHNDCFWNVKFILIFC